MALYAFVAMPFGVKKGIDFERTYADLVRPALEAAGFEACRADEPSTAGALHNGALQELLTADLVVVDVSVDHPDLWYEMGVRHALRSRGLIVIGSRDGPLPFATATERVLRYHRRDDIPDPARLLSDRAALTRLAEETTRSWYKFKESPIYSLVPALHEPDRKALQVAGASAFSAACANWSERMATAHRRNRLGDILVLAEETPTWTMRLEARRLAGKALLQQGHLTLALEQFESALAIDPVDLQSHCHIGLILGRLGMHDRARVWINDIVETHGNDAGCWWVQGCVHETEWLHRWRDTASSDSTTRQATAAAEEGLAQEAIEAYEAAFSIDPRHYRSGIRALTLRHVRRHLGCTHDPASLQILEGGLRWSCHAALRKNAGDPRALIALAGIDVLMADRSTVLRACRDAAGTAERDRFAFDAALQGLYVLRDLAFRADIINAAIDVFEGKLVLINSPKPPRQAILFSGHMIDRTQRKEPRFPADKETAAAQAIAAELARLAAGPEDTALCGGACGGDLLFAEACLARHVPLTLYLALPEAEFIDQSVAFAGQTWVERFYAVKNHPHVQILVAQDELGPAPKGVSPYSRANRWMTFSAIAQGLDRVRFITLWDGRNGDGEGGTSDMVETMKKYHLPPSVIALQ